MPDRVVRYLNIFADREEGGNHPPMPALSTVTGENWFSQGVYDIRNHIAPGSFASHEWDIVWWQPSHRWRNGLRQNHAWGYRFNRSLWEGRESAESVFRDRLRRLTGVMQASADSTGYSVLSQTDAATRLGDLNTFLTTTTGISDGTANDSGLFSLYRRIDEPEGGFQGNAAGMFAARVYDLAMRLTNMQIQLEDIRQGISDTRTGIVEAVAGFVAAYESWNADPRASFLGSIQHWYQNTTLSAQPQWTTAFHPHGRYQIPLTADGVWGAPTLGGSDTHANDAVQQVWLDHLSTLGAAAENLYNALGTTYSAVSGRVDPFRSPQGGLPPGFTPNPTIGGGDGDGTGGGTGGGDDEFDIEDLLGGNRPPGDDGGSGFNVEDLFGENGPLGGGPDGGGPDGGGSAFDPDRLPGAGPEVTTVSDLAGGPGGGGGDFDPDLPPGGVPEGGSTISDLAGGGGGLPFPGGPLPPGGSTISGGGSRSRRLETDPATGLPIDPGTGEPFPVDDNGVPFNPATGLPIALDPATGELLPIDPMTGEPLPPGGSTISNLETDPATGLPIDPETGEPFPVDDNGVPFNPATGLPIALDPATGELLPIDPMTGEPLPPGGSTISNLETDPATGLPIDPETGEPLPPPPGGSSISDRTDLSGGRTPPDLPGIPDLPGTSGGGSSFSDGGSDSSGPRTVDRSDRFALSQTGDGDLPLPQGGSSFNGSSSLPGQGTPGPGLPVSGAPGAGTGVPGTGAVDVAPGGPGADPNAAGGPPMMPPPMMGGGAGGQGEGKEQRRATWLSEDERVWGTDARGGNSAIGRPAPGEKRKAVAQHDLTDTGAPGGRTGTSSADDPRLQRKKRKPGVGIRRSRLEGPPGDGAD